MADSQGSSGQTGSALGTNTSGTTSSGVWNYDDTTGLYLNPLTGAYSYSDPSAGSSGQTGSALGTNTLGANTLGVNKIGRAHV